jgi:hypothetical protein
LAPGIHDYLISLNNQGQQGISPVQQAAPTTQQVVTASTMPGVAIAVSPAMIFINLAFIKTSSVNNLGWISYKLFRWADAI